MADSPKARDASYGLVLSLGGAPNTPHQIPGLDGTFHPSEPRSLEDCGLTLAEAKKLDADEGMPLKLVKTKED